MSEPITTNDFDPWNGELFRYTNWDQEHMVEFKFHRNEAPHFRSERGNYPTWTATRVVIARADKAHVPPEWMKSLVAGNPTWDYEALVILVDQAGWVAYVDVDRELEPIQINREESSVGIVEAIESYVMSNAEFFFPGMVDARTQACAERLANPDYGVF